MQLSIEQEISGGLARLDQPEACRSEVFGPKASRLAQLLQAGFRVPPGLALATTWCTNASAQDLERALASHLESLGPGPYAVRSSGLAEDGHVESLAGRYTTELKVELGLLSEAIRRCLEAARRVDEGDGRRPGSVALLIQVMVPADCSGVAFSRDPVSGDQVRIISAVRGLGDRLMEGVERGEEWRVSPDGKTCGPVPVEGALKSEQALLVADLLDRLELLVGQPQDVEWAFAGGELFLLQARPITALPVPPTLPDVPPGSWVKDTSHYPNGFTPLADSIYSPSVGRATAYAFERWGLLVERVEQRTMNHECYVRVVPVGDAPGPAPPAWLMGILARVVPALRRRAAIAREALESRLGERLLARWPADRRVLEASLSELRGFDLTSLDDEPLVAHLEACVDVLAEGHRIHMELFPAYVQAIHELAAFLQRRLGWETSETLELLSGLSVETSGPATALSEMARRLAGSEAATEVLRDTRVSDHELVPSLKVADPERASDWQAFIDRWGHRVLGYDLGEPTLAERPGIVRRRLLEMVDDEGGLALAQSRRREAAEVRAREALGADGLEEFDSFLEAARRWWPVREENVAYTDSMPNAVIRYACLEMGRRLVSRGLLCRAQDVAMLRREELVQGLRESLDRRDLVRQRYAERAWVAAHPGPRVLGDPEHPPPNIRYLPEAMRRTSGPLLWIAGLEFGAASAGGQEGIVGQAAAAGVARGTARMVDGPQDFHRVQRGDIMVCPTTTPAWTIVFPALAGLVAEGGGLLAHASIAAREHHIPAVLGVNEARRVIPDGATIEIDGSRGTVRILS